MGTRELGSLIRERRKGVTQEQLEELTGVSQGMISRLERGEIQRPNLEFVRAIGAALDTPYEELVGALFGSQFKAGAMVEADEILAKWRVLDIPPDVTSDELLLLKHLFVVFGAIARRCESHDSAPSRRGRLGIGQRSITT
jgi:transcriptional regulator with XRE-family HTH domain